MVESPTMAHQALIYRLSGDKVRLHIDPDVAKRGGFDGPILHGLCTYGIAAKAVIDTFLDGDTAAVVRYAVRFSGVVYPGETVVTAMWREEDRILLHATTKERGTPVLSHAAVWTH